MNTALFSSATGEWATPQDFFDEVDARFHFTVDAAASAANHKCASYFDLALDGLHQPWDGTIWCNPPYGRSIGLWTAKAEGTDSVLLVPSRTDTKWFKRAFEHAAELFLIAGRLKFGGSENSAPFPSCLFHFDPSNKGPCRTSYWWRSPHEA
jgi:phage N-6-adenine-methyltransferase